MSPPPTIVVLGAPGTGAPALCAALQARLAPAAVCVLWGHSPGHLRGSAPTAATEPHLTLLMGLDLPCRAHRVPAQAAADARLRGQLDRAGSSYRVVYGQDAQRITHALNAINNIANSAYPSSATAISDQKTAPDSTRAARLRAWHCEKCSDPECEHRLFSALTQGGESSA